MNGSEKESICASYISISTGAAVELGKIYAGQLQGKTTREEAYVFDDR